MHKGGIYYSIDEGKTSTKAYCVEAKILVTAGMFAVGLVNYLVI